MNNVLTLHESTKKDFGVHIYPKILRNTIFTVIWVFQLLLSISLSRPDIDLWFQIYSRAKTYYDTLTELAKNWGHEINMRPTQIVFYLNLFYFHAFTEC